MWSIYCIMRLYYIIQFRPDNRTNEMIYDQLQSVDSGSFIDSGSNISINTSNRHRLHKFLPLFDPEK